MSANNGDKARYQKNRKRAVIQRSKIRELVAAGTAGMAVADAADAADATKAPAKPRRAKG
jgi:hypothetical protein